MQSSIFWRRGISGLQPLDMLEYCSSISHITADHSLQQPQVFVACTIPLVWLLGEPDKVYWYAVLDFPFRFTTQGTHVVLLNKTHSHQSI